MFNVSFAHGIRYWWAFCLVLAIAILSEFIEPYIGYQAVGFLFLLTVLGVGFYNSLGPVLFTATLSSLLWNILFIPPHFTLAISKPEDAALCLGYFVAALVTGILTSRSRKMEALAAEREKKTSFLYEVVKDILDLSKPDDFIQRITWRIEELTDGKCEIILGANANPKATYSWQVRGKHGTFGQLIYKNTVAPSEELQNLLESVAQQIGLSIERFQMEGRLRETQRLEESERLHQTLLNSVSHELRTPLTTIISFASSLKDHPGPHTPDFYKAFAEGLSESSDRMNRVVGNLLDMSRLNSKTYSLRMEWHDLNDLIGVVLNSLKNTLKNHIIKVNIPETTPLVQMDFHLMEHALANLLVNAAAYTAPGSKIQIEVHLQNKNILILVTDQGAGIPQEFLPHVFKKFYRVPGSPPGGTGLGLSIVKGIAEIHNGTVDVESTKTGTSFIIQLPAGSPPPTPSEESHE